MKVELQDICKRFGNVRANSNISLSIESGMIFGLIGENGAGKSTLMKVLSGYTRADGGAILLDGQPVSISTPFEAIQHGIGMLHQDPLDFPPMKLLDNFIMGRNNQLGKDTVAAKAAFLDFCNQFDFNLDPETLVSEITMGERQQLEIIRLLWLGAHILILDEPTTGISAPQKIKLFATLKKLAKQGKTIIFVSHKLEDVEELCSEVAILRQGKLTGLMKAPLDTDGLVLKMFGRDIVQKRCPDEPLGSVLLKLEKAAVTDYRLQTNIATLSIQEGEVIGLAGMEGSGQRLLMQACSGLLPLRSGHLYLDGVDMTNASYSRFLEAGVAFMPADRMSEGLIPGLSIAEHMVIANQRQNKSRKRFMIDWNAASAEANTGISDFHIKGQPESVIESLSGGNQQRTMLSLLPENLRLLIMEHPTRGLDVESGQFIWGKLLKRRSTGTAILFASADLDELLQYSDRIAVFFGGRFLDVVGATDTSVSELGYLIAGRTRREQSDDI